MYNQHANIYYIILYFKLTLRIEYSAFGQIIIHYVSEVNKIRQILRPITSKKI